jgi:hypothetical protein
MAIIRVSDLPKKETLDGTDRIVGYSTTGGTSLLFAQSFIDIKTAAETSARNAKVSETSAQSQNAEITQKISQAKTDLSNLKTEGVNAINSAKSAGVNEVNSAKTTAVSAVNSAKTSGVAAVSDAQTNAVTAVANQQKTSVGAVQAAQSSATGEVDKAKASAVSAVQNQESASIANLKASGDVLFVGRTELETALKELIVEFGGQVPA